MAGQTYCVVVGCLLSLTLCRRGFQDLLKVRPSFLFTFSRMDTPQLFSNLIVIHLLAYEDGTEFYETSVYKIQKPGNYTQESIQHTVTRRKFEIKNGLNWLKIGFNFGACV